MRAFVLSLKAMPFSYRKIIIVLSLALLIGSGYGALSKQDGARKQAISARTKPAVEKAQTRLLKHEDGRLSVEFVCPDMGFERDSVTGRITGLDMEGADVCYQTGVPRLPTLTQLLDCLPGRVAVEVVEVESEDLAPGAMQAMPEDVPVDQPSSDEGELHGSRESLDETGWPLTWQERCAMMPLKQGFWPPEVVSVQDAGVFRGHRLISLRFNPVQVDAARGLARVIRRARVQVTVPRGETAQDRLADRPQETRLVQSLLGPMKETALPTRMVEAFGGDRGGRSTLDAVGGRWKLIVNETGIVRVTGEDLRSAGCPIEQITPYDTHIKNRGREIPIYLTGETDGRLDEYDYLDFYGEKNARTYQSHTPSLYSDPWTVENVYWLSWGDGVPGLRLGEEDGTYHAELPSQNVTYVRNVVHFEKDLKFDRLSQRALEWGSQAQVVGPLGLYDDHWFWGDRIDAMTTRDLGVSLTYPEPRSASGVIVRAALQGLTGGGSSGHHRAIVRLNGQTAPGLSIGKITQNDQNTAWTGQAAVILQNTVSGTVTPPIINEDLLIGNNTISVFLPGDGLSGRIDKIYANWFEVEYERQLRAAGSGFVQFHFDTTRGGIFSFDVRGFAYRTINVWKLGRSRLTNLTTRLIHPADEGASYSVHFQLPSDGAYDVLIFDQRYAHPPAAILPEASTRDLRAMNGAEYLLIYHDSFAGDLWLARLDSLRRASFYGLADSFRVSEIYEQFNDGIENPEAIRRFIQYAYENWRVRPTHVCLVGDAMLLMRGYQPGNLIPSLYPPTLDFGIAATDMLFGAVSGPPWDVIPDVAVGRISCRSSLELQTYVEKLLRYEDPQLSAYNTLFHATALFISDATDGQFNFGRDFTEPSIRLLPSAVNVVRVSVDSTGSQSTTALRDALRNGAVIANYNGHGGGGVWSGHKLMDVPGVRLLNNARTYPFISNFTCYVGAFDDLSQADVLGEAFLFARNSRGDPVGAIGFYSPSGVGWVVAGQVMQRKLFDFIMDPPGLTQGEVVQFNKAHYWGAYYTPGIWATSLFSQLVTMNLLGDPGLRLTIPQQTWQTFAADTNVVSSGDTLRVSGTLPWTPAGVADVYLLPFSGESFNYSVRPVWDPSRQETVYVVDKTFRRSHVRAFNPDEVVAFPVASRIFENLPVQVRGLATPQGNLVIYAVDPGRAPSEGDPGAPARDAIGSLPLFLADSLDRVGIFDVHTTPYDVIFSDSTFRIQAQIAHRDGVEQVRFRGVFRPPQGPVVLDTTAMEQTVPGEWRTPLLGPHRVLGGSYRGQFLVKPFGGEVETSDDYDLPLETTSDFAIQTEYSLSPALLPGAHPYYNVTVAHARRPGAREFPSLAVQLTAVGRDTTRIPRPPLPDSLAIAVDSFVTIVDVLQPWQQPSIFNVVVPASFRPLRYNVIVKLDPQNLIPEYYEDNNTFTGTLTNINLFPVTYVRGTYQPRLPDETAAQRYRVTGIADTIWLKMLPGALPLDSSTLIYLGPTAMTSVELVPLAAAGIRPPQPGITNYRYRVTLADSSERLVTGARVEITASVKAAVHVSTLSQAIGRIQLFHHLNESPFWAPLDERQLTVFRVDTTLGVDTTGGQTVLDTVLVITGRVSGVASELGHFAAFQFADTRGPTIELAVDGMRFTPHSLLPRHPSIYATLSDYSGIDRRPGKFYFVIDQDTIPEAEIAWSDSLMSGGPMSALVRPVLEPGHHVIRVRATDNTGLPDSLVSDFDVRGTFGFEWAINYPNPFSRSTTISYVLTDASDDFVEARVYTVSGRRVRTFREGLRSVTNYREMLWDGRDETGQELANGVYFIKLIAKQGDQKVEKIIKVAKAR
jgi:hypothetical protein